MTDAKQEYNVGAEGYQKATQRFMRKCAYEPTLMENFPNVKGKRVLDIACGDGLATRIIASLGAKEVVGIDISDELIKRTRNFHTPNVQYHVRDAIHEDLSEFGRFDVITAVMFLHYSQSKQDLKRAIQNVGQVIVPEGIFYTMTVNPELLRRGYCDYGVRITPESSQEGSRVKTELHSLDWKKFCEFSNFYWTQETYNSIFRDEGFEVQWHKGIVSEEGRKRFGDEFWKNYDKEPIYYTITAKKKESANLLTGAICN
jgi:SAM-dependent methyltransferase